MWIFQVQDLPFKLERLTGLPTLFLWCLVDRRFICRGVLGGEAPKRFSVLVSSENSSTSDSEFLLAESPSVHSGLWKTSSREDIQAQRVNVSYLNLPVRALHAARCAPQHCVHPLAELTHQNCTPRKQGLTTRAEPCAVSVVCRTLSNINQL